MSSLGNESLGKLLTGADLNPAGIALPGNCTANTPAQFDNDTSLATTEFVQRALGNMAGFEIFTASQVLNAASAGKYLIFSSSSSLTCTLPNPSGLPVGTRFYVESSGGGSLAVSASGGADFAGPNVGSSPLSTVTLRSGVSAEFIVQSATRYRFVGGSGEAFLASNGYQKLPSGLIVQWGITGSIAPGSSANQVLPVAFPNAALSAVATAAGAGTNGNAAGVGVGLSTTNITVYNWGSVLAYGAGVRWIAIGY